jgi:hypothetical protein
METKMKSIKIEVIDGCIHFDDKVYIKGEIFEIDEKNAKNLIENKVAKEVEKIDQKLKTNTKSANDKNEAQSQGQTEIPDAQTDVFGKINEDLNSQNQDKDKNKDSDKGKK